MIKCRLKTPPGFGLAQSKTLSRGYWFSAIHKAFPVVLVCALMPVRKKRGVIYSRPNTGTDMPSKERFRARPFWACLESRPRIESVSFVLDGGRSPQNCKIVIGSGLHSRSLGTVGLNQKPPRGAREQFLETMHGETFSLLRRAVWRLRFS